MNKKQWLASLAVVGMLACGSVVAQERSVAVNGVGEVRAEPDRATVNLGIESRKPKLEEARAEVNRGVDAVLKLMTELKIDPKHVRTTRINVQPEYDWNNQGRERALLGYYVSRQVEIDLRNLDQLGTLMERALSIGVNQVGEPQLDSSRRRDLEREALAKAVADARLNAEALAKAAGAKVGSPRRIAASSDVVMPPMPMMRAKMMGAEASDASQSYQRGEMTFNANVQVEYELLVSGGAP